MSDYNSVRRYYLRERLNARMLHSPTEGVWRWKQERQPGTALPAGYPYLVQLTVVGYTTFEDLFGADNLELLRLVGLQKREAEAVLGEYDRAMALLANPDTAPTDPVDMFDD